MRPVSFLPQMTAYIRTDEGQIAAYDPQSALPRKLKSLLKLIDGRTSLAVLEESLRAFGDVRGLVQSLEAAGLAKPLADGVKAERSGSGPTSAMSHDSVANWPGSPTPLGQSQLSTRFPAPTASDALRGQALHKSVDMMANFVLTHLPGQSFTLLKELEALTSLEQLAATLGGYEQVVSQVGAASRGHLAQLKQILREHL